MYFNYTAPGHICTLRIAQKDAKLLGFTIHIAWPLKWIIYAAELQDIVSRHGISFHGFAEDSQLSKSMFVSNIQTGKRAMLDCIADVEALSLIHI